MRCREKLRDALSVRNKSSPRFFTVTGHQYGSQTQIAERQAQFDALYAKVFGDVAQDFGKVDVEELRSEEKKTG